MARLSLHASRATTISRFFYVLAGHQPCLDFFMCQQDINQVWTFLCDSRTSTMYGLFYGSTYRFSEEMSKRQFFIDNSILKEDITGNTF